MGYIVAIGGGDITKNETLNIDNYMISLLEDSKRNILLIPIASNDNKDYIETFTAYYEKLGFNVSVLRLSVESNDILIRSKIFEANIIYIGGGNTGKLLRVFKRCNIKEYLKMALDDGAIVAGISAGAMALFNSGYSDCNRSTNINNPLSYLKCMGLLPYCFCPHYEENERKSFDEFIKTIDENGLAIDSRSAVVFKDYKIVDTITNNSNCYLFKNKHKEIL